MIRDGLTITNVLTGFQILPSWGHQIGAHFQLDNIRWVKGPAVPVTSQVCWAQRFNSYDPMNVRIDQFANSTDLIQMTQLVPTSVFIPTWASQPKFGHAAGTDASFASCGTNSTLSANVYIPASYVNDGHLSVSFYAIDQGGDMTFSQPISVAGVKGNDWNFITTPLWFYSSTAWDFNASDVAFLGVIFNSSGKDPLIDGVLKVDNIMVTQPIQ